MNIDRIRQLADIIEQQPHTTLDEPSGFNMCNWNHTCGTPACIAGWTNWLREHEWLGDIDGAADWLDISIKHAIELFIPDDEYDQERLRWSEITPAHAAAVLRHLADTGEVDWSVRPEERA